MTAGATRILTRGEIAELLDLDTCRRAVEEAFRQHGTGEAPSPALLGQPVEGGGFHLKAGALRLGRRYFAAKMNGNFSANGPRGLPRIQGVVVLSDATTGSPLAVLDSAEITRLRTAAATAVAAQHLAPPDARVVTLCGCGVQGRAQLQALARVLPLQSAFCFDESPSAARSFADELSASSGFSVSVARDLRSAAAVSDVVVTCTSSRTPFLLPGSVRAGAFVAAVGADSPEKQEIDPVLMAAATIVTDVTEQCASIGDLHHAIAAGLLTRESVHAELGEIVAGRKAGRRSPGEIIVFDSTGMALQDVAAAAAAFERAEASGRGLLVSLTA